MIALYIFTNTRSTVDAATFCARHELSREEVVSVVQSQSSGHVDGEPYEAITITLVLDCTRSRLRQIDDAERDAAAAAFAHQQEGVETKEPWDGTYDGEDAPVHEVDPEAFDTTFQGMADLPY